jgi:hypothetical protein
MNSGFFALAGGPIVFRTDIGVGILGIGLSLTMLRAQIDNDLNSINFVRKVEIRLGGGRLIKRLFGHF